MLLSDLKLAAFRNNSLSDSNSRNDRSGVNIRFVADDELSLAHFMEHRVSENKFYSDKSGFSHEESGRIQNMDPTPVDHPLFCEENL